MAGIGGNRWKWLKMAGNDWKWLETAQKTMGTAEHGWKQIKHRLMAGNC